MVVEGRPDRYVNLFAKPDMRGDRYLKWCLTHNQALELENVEHFEVGLLATTIPDLLNRLEDERDTFLQTFRCRLLHDGCRVGPAPRTGADPCSQLIGEMMLRLAYRLCTQRPLIEPSLIKRPSSRGTIHHWRLSTIHRSRSTLSTSTEHYPSSALGNVSSPIMQPQVAVIRGDRQDASSQVPTDECPTNNALTSIGNRPCR